VVEIRWGFRDSERKKRPYSALLDSALKNGPSINSSALGPCINLVILELVPASGAGTIRSMNSALEEALISAQPE
jgi:hypothetical protein